MKVLRFEDVIKSGFAKNKRVFIRADLNVPQDNNGNITEDTRIKASLPAIQMALQAGAAVMVTSHLGRPTEGVFQAADSLAPVAKRLSELLGQEVQLKSDWLAGVQVDSGQVVLLENCRLNPGEKKNAPELAKQLASLCDVYVNDAFGTAHRAHASTAVIGQFFSDKVSGYVMQAELDNAQKILEYSERPFTAIMGGSKISDKILIIERLLDKVDNLIIGGGMTYTFSLAEGGKIGKSICEPDKVELAKQLIEKAKAKGVNLIMPLDNVCADDFNNNANRQTVERGEIPDGWEGLDIGPKSIALFQETIAKSKTILWNGPMGVFEFSNFAIGTNAIADAVVKATEENGAFSLIGGGDSASAVNNAGYGDRVSYVSTGGGALLEYMEGKVLPGVAALEA